MIALIAICIIISLSSVVEENILNLKKISEDYRFDSFGFAIFIYSNTPMLASGMVMKTDLT